MNAIRTVVKMYTRDTWIWFFLLWMVLLLQFLLTLIVILIMILLFGGKTPVYPGGLITICVIMFVVGIITLNDTFPFALGFGCAEPITFWARRSWRLRSARSRRYSGCSARFSRS